MKVDDAVYRCFTCGVEINAATILGEADAAPRAGDPSLCLRCGGLAVFTGNGVEIREATGRELVEFNRTDEVRRARGLLLRYWAEQGRPAPGDQNGSSS